MGLIPSKQTPKENVFQSELRGVNDIVTKILSENDTFKNKDYNFLSTDVCNKFQVILENDLKKHLKVHLAEFKSNIYFIPKEDPRIEMPKINMTKPQICEMISSHYIKILYILCLVKYVYNIELNGDRSFGGTITRNIEITNNLMKVLFCDTDQRDARNTKNPNKINLANMDGFKFFVQYFLAPEESKGFMKLMRSILGKRSKAAVRNAIQEGYHNRNLSKIEYDILSQAYSRNFGEPITSTGRSSASASVTAKTASHDTIMHDTVQTPHASREIDTSVFIAKDNPVLLTDYCTYVDNRVIDIATKEGSKAKKAYDIMMQNYKKNIAEIEGVLKEIVKRDGNTYQLLDIDSGKLDDIVNKAKQIVRRFFVQGLLDYQHLLDIVKTIPSVKVSIENNNGFL